MEVGATWFGHNLMMLFFSRCLWFFPICSTHFPSLRCWWSWLLCFQPSLLAQLLHSASKAQNQPKPNTRHFTFAVVSAHDQSSRPKSQQSSKNLRAEHASIAVIDTNLALDDTLGSKLATVGTFPLRSQGTTDDTLHLALLDAIESPTWEEVRHVLNSRRSRSGGTSVFVLICVGGLVAGFIVLVVGLRHALRAARQ
jgi:hypothetical protein